MARTDKELKEYIYEQLSMGVDTKVLTKELSDEHRNITRVVLGCKMFYDNNRDKFDSQRKEKQNPFKTELENNLEELSCALDVLAKFTCNQDETENRLQALDYMQQKVLHDLEGVDEENEEEVERITKQLLNIRRKRRMLKKEIDTKKKVTQHLTQLSSPRYVPTVKNVVDRELSDIKTLNPKVIATTYEKGLENKLTKEQKRYYGEFQKCLRCRNTPLFYCFFLI